MLDALPHPVSSEEATEGLLKAIEPYKAALRLYYLSSLHRSYLRAQKEPEWQEWIDGKDLCPKCGWGNWAPVVHSRLLYKGVGCCECGTCFRYPPDVAYGQPYETLNHEKESTNYRLKSLGFSLEAITGLASKYGYYLMRNAFGLPSGCYV